MNKRSFVTGIFVGISLTIAVILFLPSITDFWDNDRKAQISDAHGNEVSSAELTQGFVDYIASGEINEAKALLAEDGFCDSTIFFDDKYLLKAGEEPTDLHQYRLSTIYPNVPIFLVRSEEITQAMAANEISSIEYWCAEFIAEDYHGKITDAPYTIVVMTCNDEMHITTFKYRYYCH